METSSGVLGVCMGLFAVVGCSFGGTSANVDTGKMQSTRKVAIAGICVQKTLTALRGTQDVAAFPGDGAKILLDPIAASISNSLPKDWEGVQVTPLATTADPSRPVGENRVCANGIDPMMPGGYVGTPDKAYLGALASKLGVDAVLVISGDPMIRFFDGKGAKGYLPSIGSGFEMTLVNRAGEEVAVVKLKDFETDYFPDAGKDKADAEKIGSALGKLVSQGFVTVAKGGEFNPPSRPGMSGL